MLHYHVLGCYLTDKYGRLNLYSGEPNDRTVSAVATDYTITFHCPQHGPFTIPTSDPDEVGHLEGSSPTRNLLRSMSHMLDTSTHHLFLTGSEYAAMYQGVLLYRPLADWSRATGLATGRTPHILCARLVVDWCDMKLFKSLYADEDGYQVMELLGTEGLYNFAQLRMQFDDDGTEGQRTLWEEVQGWVEDPRKLSRKLSVDYGRADMGMTEHEPDFI